jgi:site-specific recombinase XerD
MVIEPFTWHCLRHTYATILYDAGVDVLTAKDLLGHEDVKTTLGIYTHLSEEKKQNDISKLNSYLSNNNTKVGNGSVENA